MDSAKKYFNYAVSFSDWTFKTGITASPFPRLQDFIQEANRHSVKVDGFKITAPSISKRIALDVESEICKKYEHDAIEGHREWFRHDTSWMRPKFKREFLKKHNHLFDFEYLFCVDLDKAWINRSAINHPFLVKRRDPFAYETYKALADLAAALGKAGDRFSVPKALQQANYLVAQRGME